MTWLKLYHHSFMASARSVIIHITIFTLANNFLRWTYLGPTGFIHPWTALFHAMLRVSDVIDKCNRWLADVTFDWRRVMVTAVERNNQTRRIKTFLRRLFARNRSIFHKLWTKTMQKQSVNMNATVPCTVNIRASLSLHVTRCVHTSMNLRKMKFISKWNW